VAFSIFAPVALLILAWVSPAAAQSSDTGTITGRVLNEGTGEYLRNAVVTVDGTEISAVTGEGGHFRLVGVPAGTAKVVVFYTGLDKLETSVTVTAGQSVSQDFGLTSAIYGDTTVVLEEFQVNTEREGNAKAIMQQRVAINTSKVIAADAIGNVSEGNVGEFLKLMPGVKMDYVEADARQLRVRGMNPKYSTVLLDGFQVASSGSSNIGTGRGFEFEMLSIDAVETVALTKAPTPDQPSSVSGVVNLETKSALDYKGRRGSWSTSLSTNSYYASLSKTEGWDDEEHYKILPNYSLEYSDVFRDGTIGLSAGLAHNSTMAAQKHIWFFYNNFNGTPTNPNFEDNATELPVINRVWFQDGPKPTERDSYNLRLDFRPNEFFSTNVRLGYNTYDARFYNRTLSLRPATYAPGATKESQTITSGRVSIDSNQFMTKEGNTTVLSSNSTYTRGNFSADLGLHYSRARNWYGNVEYGHFTDYSSSLSGISWTMNRSSPGSTALTLTQTSGPDWKNPANYNFDANSIGWHERQAKDQQWSVRLDLKNDFSDAGIPNVLKYGVLSNLKVLDVKRAGLLTANPTGPDRVMGTADDLRPVNFVDTKWRSDWEFGGNTDDWPALSPWQLHDSYSTTPGSWVENPGNEMNRIRNQWDLREEINAAYVADTVKFGDLRVTPGLRYETTESWGKGWDAVHATFITDGNDYDSLLYYLHADYEINRNLVVRASYHTAITRADPANLIPGISNIDYTAQTVTGTNPDLKEERSKTFNLAIEYYFEPAGYLSVSGFQTTIDDRQFANQTIIGEEGYGGDPSLAGFRLFGPVNIPAPTTLKGIEFDYSQQLTMLPGAFAGLGVFANFTFIDYDDWAFYTNSPKEMRNIGISYRYKAFSARLNSNWVGRQLTNPSRTYSSITDAWTWAAPYALEYQKDRMQYDMNMEFRVTDRVTLFLDARNLTNAASDSSYRETEQNFIRVLHTGTIWLGGVKGTF
jgi:TonB-dependent receptor